jgi:hypothetical protein
LLRGRRVLLVAGSFDVLLASHARDLAGLRDGRCLAVAVVDAPGAPLSLCARAELVASLAAVDAVFAVESLEDLVAGLQPDEVIHLEVAHRERLDALTQHIQRRHGG